MIETVFFDIGGVLLTNGWDERQRAAVLSRLNVDLAAYEARHEAANWHWERGLKDNRWFFDQTVFYEPRCFTFGELWREVEAQSHVTFPGTFEILSDLRVARRKAGGRYKLATLNNESRELNDYRVQAFDLRSYFDFFICSGYVGEMKPLPGIYRTALEISGSLPAQTLFIDDKAENCEAARELGMNALQFFSSERLRSDFAAFGITL
jgi:putative hydrolase of the HAD superfamily